MADLRSLLKQAKRDAEEAKTNVDNLGQVRENIKELDRKSLEAINDFVKNYPNSLTSSIEINEGKIEEYASRIQDTSIRLQQKVQSAKGTLAFLTKSKEGGYRDVTSHRMMLDYAAEYKIAYFVVICKIILFFVILTNIFSKRNLFLTIAVTVGVVVIWYSWNFILNFFNSPRIGGDTDKNKKCADGITPANSTGSNCKNTCPGPVDSVFSSYTSCGESPFGCCPDGTPSLDASGNSCAPILACASSQFGCCPDLLSERVDPEGTECDWSSYDDQDKCAETVYGCCPNGNVKLDKEGSNCTIGSRCGSSAFGCCPKGTERSDLAGSNCTAIAVEPSSVASSASSITGGLSSAGSIVSAASGSIGSR